MSYTNVTCDYCGKRFYKRPSHILRSKTNCCSIECSAKLRSEWMSGAGNHQFGLKGELNSSYLSDIKISTYGYILLRAVNHPLRNSDDMVFAHRLVIEEFLKREDPGSMYLINVDGVQVLSPEYDVHHRDGNRLNNSSNNLELVTRAEHTALHNREEKILKRNEDGTYSLLTSTKLAGKLSRKHKFDAGADVYSAETCTVHARSHRVISTGLKVSILPGLVGILWSRSGLSVKYGIEVGAGCIDSGFTGEVLVNLYNHSDKDYEVTKGDRIAQLLTMPLSPSDYGDEEDTIKRGDGGFGSTGV